MAGLALMSLQLTCGLKAPHWEKSRIAMSVVTGTALSHSEMKTYIPTGI